MNSHQINTFNHRDTEAQRNDFRRRTLAIAAEAGQIFRPTTWADWGIDGEIEFKDYEGKASGYRVYLQLKSGDQARCLCHLDSGCGEVVF